MPSLIITEPGGKTRTIELRRSGMIVGRGADADVKLDEIKCSRKHLKINLINTAIEILDLGSANGTFIQNTRVRRIVVQPGDIVCIGKTELTFQREGEAPGATPPRAAVATTPTVPTLPNARMPAKPAVAPARKASGRARQAARASDRQGRIQNPFVEKYHVEVVGGPLKGARFALGGKFTIGRKAGVGLMLEGANVSSRHALIEHVGDSFHILDLGSTNGTFLNAGLLEANVQHKLEHGDTLDVGDHRILFRAPMSLRGASVSDADLKAAKLDSGSAEKHGLVLLSGPRKGERIPLGIRLSIGRSAENGLVIEGKRVSSVHAEIVVSDRSFVVVDANSTNGTIVNGKRVKSHTLKHQDVITIGEHAMVYAAEGEMLDLDGRLAELRSEGRQRVFATAIVGLAVSAACAFFIFYVVDLVIAAVAPKNTATASNNDADNSDGAVETEDPDPLGFEPGDGDGDAASEDEYDPFMGWKLTATGRGLKMTLASDAEGKHALVIVPQTNSAGQPIDVGARPKDCSFLLRPAPDSAAFDALISELSRAGTAGGGHVVVSIQCRTEGLSGLVGVRLMTELSRGGMRAQVAAWSTKDSEGSFRTLTGEVSVPYGAQRSWVEVFGRGVFETVTFDELALSAGSRQAGLPVLDTVELPECTDRLIATEDIPGTLRFALGSRSMIRRASLAHLVERGDGWTELASTGQGSGPITRGAASYGDRPGATLSTAFLNPSGTRAFEAKLQIVPHPAGASNVGLAEDPRFTVTFGTGGYKLQTGERLALKLELPWRAGADVHRLIAYDDDGNRFATEVFDMPSPMRGLREIVWGTDRSRVAIEVSPFGGGELLLLGREETSGPVLYIIVADESMRFPLTLNVRPFSTIERQQALGLRDDLARLESDVSRRGDVLKLALRARTSFPQYADLSALFSRYYDDVRAILDTLFDELSDTYDDCKRRAERGRHDRRAIRRGLMLCRQFVYEFAALIDADPENPYNRVSRWERDLISWDLRAQYLEDEAAMGERREQVVKLLSLAFAAYDPHTGGSRSYLKAVLFAEHAAGLADYDWTLEAGEIQWVTERKGMVQAARDLIDEIETFWADTERLIATLDATETAVRRYVGRNNFRDAIEKLEEFLRLYPHPPRAALTRYRLLRTAVAIDWYVQEKGSLPSALIDEDMAAYLPGGRPPRDAWGYAIGYTRVGGSRRFRLSSLGADQRAGGVGDDADVEQLSLTYE